MTVKNYKDIGTKLRRKEIILESSLDIIGYSTADKNAIQAARLCIDSETRLSELKLIDQQFNNENVTEYLKNIENKYNYEFALLNKDRDDLTLYPKMNYIANLVDDDIISKASQVAFGHHRSQNAFENQGR